MLRSVDASKSFIAAVKAISGKGRVQTDIFDRVRRTFEGEEYKLVQVAIYRAGRSDDHLQFGEDGVLERQPFRPVLEAAVVALEDVVDHEDGLAAGADILAARLRQGPRNQEPVWVSGDGGVLIVRGLQHTHGCEAQYRRRV